MKCWLGKSTLDTEKAVCVCVCEEDEDKRVWSTSSCMIAPVNSRVSVCMSGMYGVCGCEHVCTPAGMWCSMCVLWLKECIVREWECCEGVG